VIASTFSLFEIGLNHSVVASCRSLVKLLISLCFYDCVQPGT